VQWRIMRDSARELADRLHATRSFEVCPKSRAYAAHLTRPDESPSVSVARPALSRFNGTGCVVVGMAERVAMAPASITLRCDWSRTPRLVMGLHREIAMTPIDSSHGLGLSEFSYGSVWLVEADDGHPRHLSTFTGYALGTAAAVIHHLATPRELLDPRKPAHYREAGSHYWAVGRSIQLAQSGRRAVRFVECSTLKRAREHLIPCAEHEIPFRILLSAGQAIGREAPLGFFLVRTLASLGLVKPHSSLVLLVATPPSEAALSAKRRPQPLGFSMPGVAGYCGSMETSLPSAIGCSGNVTSAY
jgi:hypothetical protein